MKRYYKGIRINASKNTHETVFEMIKESTDKTVVDIPSGNGAFVQRLNDQGFKNVFAVDIENILEISHDNFVQGDMTMELPVSNNSFDILVCIEGIEHINRQVDFIREANRILTDQGAIIITSPNISSLRSRWKWFWTGHHYRCSSPLNENAPNPLHHISMTSFSELRYMLHTNGFRINEIKTNRIKPVSLLYSIFLPLVFLSTSWIYIRTGNKKGTSEINKSVFRQVFSREILFGETLIVKAIKTGTSI